MTYLDRNNFRDRLKACIVPHMEKMGYKRAEDIFDAVYDGKIFIDLNNARNHPRNALELVTLYDFRRKYAKMRELGCEEGGDYSSVFAGCVVKYEKLPQEYTARREFRSEAVTAPKKKRGRPRKYYPREVIEYAT